MTNTNHQSLKLQVGLDSISSYKRLAYTPWHALAEFVDNSTQSYFNNREELDALADKNDRPLKVAISYDLEDDLLRIEDNSIGMSYEELKNALHVSRPPTNTSGRSKYGMGMKTAACWIGNYWEVRTKKLGETIEYKVTIDVETIANGNAILPYSEIADLSPTLHYTIIEIRKHNRKFKGRTLGKIEQYLSSMYREDFRNKILNLIWRGKPLNWDGFEDRLLQDYEGKPYWKEFKFTIEEIVDREVQTKTANGWVGILRDGSRSNAGFSILHSGRVVKGWPDSWRPSTLYGQEQGSNDLVNQRLIGEIHLDEFEVSHTKDDILWLGDQLDLIENGLLEECGDYKEVAKAYRKTKDDRRGPSEIETNVAVDTLQQELASPELADVLATDPMLPEQLVKQVVNAVTNFTTSKFSEKFHAQIDELNVRLYLEEDMSPNDPYVTIDSSQRTEVIIIVNAAHPHWNQLYGSQGVLNYLRHCTYDGIAEWQARNKTARLDPDTIKLLKDKLLRIPLLIEQHQA